MCRRFCNKDQVVRTSEDYCSLKKTRRLTFRIERLSGPGKVWGLGSGHHSSGLPCSCLGRIPCTPVLSPLTARR